MKYAHLAAATALVTLTGLCGPAFAQAFTITDIAGREVSFEAPIERVILGEGRLIYSLAPIETENPFAKVVGWRDDLYTTDEEVYEAYAEKFPEVRDITYLGNLTGGTLQVETLVDLDPDVVLFPISSKQAADEVQLEQTLSGIGIQIVYVDFREHVIDNTIPSLHILGELFDKPERAQEVADYWQAEIDRVTDVINAQADLERQNVFVYRAAGLVECCGTYGPDNFGLMVDMAGGHNIGSDFLPGFSGSLNPEQVVASNPDVVIVTGSNWSHYDGAEGFVSMGHAAAATVEDSRAALAALMQEPAFTGSDAVANGRVYGIWHQFYTNPYQFVAIQQLAKWLHPELFADLDPEATFQEFHDRFLPIDYSPGYWFSLEEGK